MKNSELNKPALLTLLMVILFATGALAQNSNVFSERIHFGGSLGLSIGSGFTNIVLAPSFIYDVNQYFSAGAGIQGSYVSWENNFESYIYGASLIGLFNPIEQVQLSAELEQLRVNTTYDDNFKDNFWNTALFIGAGYRTNNVTIGVRYNILFKERNNVYNEPFMPFIRVFF
jgi:hypothetical protein